jgi:hypothetical protein
LIPSIVAWHEDLPCPGIKIIFGALCPSPLTFWRAAKGSFDREAMALELIRGEISIWTLQRVFFFRQKCRAGAFYHQIIGIFF